MRFGSSSTPNFKSLSLCALNNKHTPRLSNFKSLCLYVLNNKHTPRLSNFKSLCLYALNNKHTPRLYSAYTVLNTATIQYIKYIIHLGEGAIYLQFLFSVLQGVCNVQCAWVDLKSKYASNCSSGSSGAFIDLWTRWTRCARSIEKLREERGSK